MLLIDYLNGLDLSDDELVSHFATEFGVKVKIENDLFLFKYDQLGAKWGKPLVRECRGVILRKLTNGTFKVASRPFDKFFNRHEGHCSLFDPKAFAAACPRLYMAEKADGTCIQVWWDEVEGRWRASTLGTITTTQCGDSAWTFEELFWATMKAYHAKALDYIVNELDHRYTLITELCTEENRILTKYARDVVFLLGVRDNETGEVLPSLREVPLMMTRGDTELMRAPLLYPFERYNIVDVDSAAAFVEGEARKDDLYGEYAEGFVIYDENGPVCKMKNERYIQLHHASGAGDTRCTRNKVIEAFFAGNMDDLYPVLVPSMKEFADKLKDWWNGKIGDLMKAAGEFRGKIFEDGKAYAMFVHGNVDKQFISYFFQNKVDALSNDGIPIGYKLDDTDADTFAAWMKKHYKAFEKEMKALSGI